MIFAAMDYPQTYADFHPELRTFLSQHFSKVESGLQGDSWFWIFDEDEKVEVDTFSSMKHQIKSGKAGPLVQRVIETLSRKYNVKVYQAPEPEAHEE